MVIMTVSGAFVVALGLPSVYGRSTPLASSAEETPQPITGRLDKLDAEGSQVEPPPTKTVEPTAAKTVEPPAARTDQPPAASTVQSPAARTDQPPAARAIQSPAARTVEPAATPNRTANGPAVERNTAVPASPSQRTVAPRAVVPSVADHRGSAALTAVAFARAQLGKPYVWGGNGEPGFDCSGLTKASYAVAKTAIPRTAQAQYNHGPRLPVGAPLQPGDLLFFGVPSNIHHVGISLGGTLMIHAPTFGQTVQIQDYRNFHDYAGASRPAT
jgi:cell wall-associated NlpC family hydrolase